MEPVRLPASQLGTFEGSLLVGVLIAGFLLAVGESTLPLFRCPACHDAFGERMRHLAALPADPFQKAAILRWASSDLCSLCANGGRVTFIQSRKYGGRRPW